MELVMAYNENQLPVNAGYIIAENWDRLHESDDYSISIFAGRSTGKTVNLVMRALASEYNVTIFTSLLVCMKEIMTLIREISPSTLLQVSSNHEFTNIELTSGKRIRIFTSTSRQANGIDITNEEVFFDEFEMSGVNERLRTMYQLLSNAKRVICIGSVYKEGGSAAKQWFKHSNTKVFIDADTIPNQYHIKDEEYQPSIIAEDIEELEDVYL